MTAPAPLRTADRNVCLTQPDDRLLAQCAAETYRASGPGGQHRNKTESAVRLTHRPTGVVVTATERRSQHENRAKALKRLRRAIALEVRTPPPSAPSAVLRAAIRSAAWPRISQKTETYLVVAAEILDYVEACQGKMSEAAEQMGITTAPLLKFLSLDDDLWEMAGRIRRRFGLGPLR